MEYWCFIRLYYGIIIQFDKSSRCHGISGERLVIPFVLIFFCLNIHMIICCLVIRYYHIKDGEFFLMGSSYDCSTLNIFFKLIHR